MAQMIIIIPNEVFTFYYEYVILFNIIFYASKRFSTQSLFDFYQFYSFFSIWNR